MAYRGKRETPPSLGAVVGTFVFGGLFWALAQCSEGKKDEKPTLPEQPRDKAIAACKEALRDIVRARKKEEPIQTVDPESPFLFGGLGEIREAGSGWVYSIRVNMTYASEAGPTYRCEVDSAFKVTKVLP